MNRLFRSVLAALSAVIVLPAAAHAVLEYRVGNAGASYKATVQIGHGCGASPTRQVVVQIPAGVSGAKPMPKAGWSLTIERAALPKPVPARHGPPRTEDVVRVTWTARTAQDALPADQYDEFVLVAQLPDTPGPLWWPISQICETGRMDWTEVPAPGQSPAALRQPAALLEVLPGAAQGGHSH